MLPTLSDLERKLLKAGDAYSKLRLKVSGRVLGSHLTGGPGRTILLIAKTFGCPRGRYHTPSGWAPGERETAKEPSRPVSRRDT